MNQAFICDAVRTPFGRFGGALATMRADDLAALPLKALLERNPGLDPSRIDDVIFGCANQAGEDNRNVARMALLLAGLPESVPGSTINRLCGSSLDAIGVAARAIKSGETQLMIAGGVETYLEGMGYPVSSTRKVADHSRVECVVTVPGLSDSDGSAKPANWSDVQTDLVSLAAGAQSAVTDQGDYTVLVYVQSANGDNLLAADSSKVIYDKFKTAADAAAKNPAAEKTVYVSATGSKYHSKPDCGNMSSAKEITLSEAQSRGLTACSRCW